MNMTDKDYITWLTTYEPPAVQETRDWFAWMRGETMKMAEQEHKRCQTCKWKLDDKDVWTTECGSIISDSRTSFSWIYCPWCGGEMKQVEGEA